PIPPPGRVSRQRAGAVPCQRRALPYCKGGAADWTKRRRRPKISGFCRATRRLEGVALLTDGIVMDSTSRRQVAGWLFAVCALLFIMIVVGGITRLTRSGLSIVEWQPIVGTLPPLTDAQWHEVFEKYKLTPEYQQVNFGMSLAEFKRIFWWEYIHRLLGRLIGLAFLLPYLGFLLRRRLDRSNAWRLGFVFMLGAAQGVMGWYMVMSGLVDDPHVSQFRLTAHLGLA